MHLIYQYLFGKFLTLSYFWCLLLLFINYMNYCTALRYGVLVADSPDPILCRLANSQKLIH